jgi:hypothetical protein
MLGVFVPSLMGAGILVSGAILLADVVKRFIPKRGVRRRHRVAMGTVEVVAAAAAWAEREVSAGELLDRVPRSRITYAGWTVACAAAAFLIPYATVEAYRDVLGPLRGNPWMIGIGVAGGITFGLAAALLATIAALASRPPRPIACLISRTALGQFRVPDPLLIEDPQKGGQCEER